MEKSSFCKTIGELMVNGMRFTHPDFLTGELGNSVSNVVNQVKSLARERLTASFIESNDLTVRVSRLGRGNGETVVIHIN